MCRHKAGWAETWQWPKFQMFRTSFWISNWNVDNAPVYEHDYCRPKFRFPSTRISFAVHTLHRYVIIPNNNILRSHLKRSWKWVADKCQPVWLKKQQGWRVRKSGWMIYKKKTLELGRRGFWEICFHSLAASQGGERGTEKDIAKEKCQRL